MKMNYFETRKARIEIIPMIDVMLFLLVFFVIVTMNMISDAGVNLNLPQASTAKPLPHPEFTINVLQNGTLKLKGHEITLDEFIETLKNDGNPDQTQVTIATDKETKFQNFVSVINAAQKAGVTNIGIATQPGSNEPVDGGVLK